MAEKRFKEEFLEEMNEIKKEKSIRVTVDDIIGLVDCEPTDSVEEVRKLRGRESEKRFIYCEEENGEFPFPYIKYDGKKVISLYECVDLLNQLAEKNEQLKSEINMLKTTIGRNEGYIDRLTHKGEWR